MGFFEVLMWLTIGHFLCDYPLQNDYIAINKNPRLNGDESNPVWGWCMTGHAFIHAAPVMWLTGRVDLSVVMIVTHFAIDYIKCIGKIDYNQDQILHLLVIFFLSTLIVGW